MRNCTRDEGGPFEIGNQVLISSHRKLLWSKAMVVSVVENRNEIPAGEIERGERKPNREAANNLLNLDNGSARLVALSQEWLCSLHSLPHI